MVVANMKGLASGEWRLGGAQAPPHTRRVICRRNCWMFLLQCTLVATGVFAQLVTVAAQTPPQFQSPSELVVSPFSKQSGPRGGTMIAMGSSKVELVIASAGIQLFAYDENGLDLNLQRARGLAVVKIASDPKSYRYDLLPDDAGALSAHANLSRVQGKQIEVDVQLSDVATFGGGRIQFHEVLTIPPSAQQMAASAIARQKVCPVTGRPLGSMGEPLPVRLGERTIYVCSTGCIATVENSPTRYAGGKPTILVTTATAEDAELIAKQARCPVMDESLGSMGQPIKVMVGDKPVFLCCKGCVKKVEQQPGKYVSMVYGDVNLNDTFVSPAGPEGEARKIDSSATPQFVPAGSDAVRPGVFRVSDADARFIAAQQKCPVMDEPLDSMGGPLKVHADGRAIYICCPGCAKRIVAEPQKYIAILKQQGTDAPRIR